MHCLGPFTSGNFYGTMEEIVGNFKEKYEERMKKIEEDHFQDVSNLQQLQKNYGRLLQRAGYRKAVIQDTFDKKKKKDIRTIVKKNRRKQLEQIIARTSEDNYYGVVNDGFKK